MNITNKVVSDRITRERTFDVQQIRADKQDGIAQAVLTIGQILEDNFTGCIEVHCAAGKIINIKAKESQRVP